MKLSTLFAPVAALALAFPASVSAEQLSLTFNRTGTTASSVNVIATGIEGVSASMTDASAPLKNTTGSFTSGIVAHSSNFGDNPNVTMQFTITGLPAGFKYDQIGLDIHALNGQGGYQAATDAGVNRYFNITVSTGESASTLNEFSAKKDLEIAYGVNPTGTRHKVWDFAGEAVSATDPLVISINVTRGSDNQGCFFGLSEIIITGEMAAPAPTVVSTKDIFGTLTTTTDETETTPDTKITLSEYSDGTYGLLLENYGATENDPGLGDIEVLNITREGNDIKANNVGALIFGGLLTADMDLIGTYDGNDLTFHLDIITFGGTYTADFTSVKEPEPAGLTFRRYSKNANVNRYYNHISYTVNEVNTVIYEVENPLNESYHVAPIPNDWTEDGAYIDFTEKVINVPVDAKNFAITLKTKDGSDFTSKWSQDAIFVDWNNNGDYTDEGETNGVLNIDAKPNVSVISAEGSTDVIAVPEGLNVGDTFSVLITMMEPIDFTENFKDKWSANWEWTKVIFSDGVCSLVNGRAYELTLKMTEGTTSAINAIDAENNAAAEYFNLQGMRVAADRLTPGIYVIRKGNETFKALVK